MDGCILAVDGCGWMDSGIEWTLAFIQTVDRCKQWVDEWFRHWMDG